MRANKQGVDVSKTVIRGKGSKTVDPIRDLEQVRRIRDVLEGTNPRDASMFTFNVHVGLRGSDLLSLRWESLIEGDSVRRVLRLSEGKTGRTAKLELPPAAQQAIRRWWELVHFPKEGIVFPSQRTLSAMNVASLHALVNKWAKAAGVQGHFGSHSLRKTFGYHAYSLGHLTLEDLQWRFGHSSPATTLRYIGVTDETVNEKVRKLDLTKPLNLTKALRKRRKPKPTVEALAEVLSKLPEHKLASLLVQALEHSE